MRYALYRLMYAIAFSVALFLMGCASDAERPAEVPPARPVEEQAIDTTGGLEGSALRETVYVPTYSHIYIQDGTREFDLAATLSIRNTDPDHPIVLDRVSYHNSDGQLVRQYLDAPVRLGPLASRAYVIEERDRTGGVGANFIVEWQAATRVSAPVIEAIMISTASAQGISFVSRGQVVRPLPEDSLR